MTFWFSRQSDILVLADVTPPGMEKLKSQVNVTFWFWLMYPPRNGKVEISGQCDILVQADVAPPPEIEIKLNMNAIEQREVIKYIL